MTAVDYVRSLNPGLPRAVWLLQGGGLLNWFGNGFVNPFLIIYLHNVKGISLGVAGLVAAANAGAALVSSPLAGTLSDRVGAKATLMGALAVMAAAFCAFPLIETGWHALALNAAVGFGSGAFWPSQSSLLMALTPSDRRVAAFAQQRVTMNLGIGLGAAAGGLVATTENVTTFTVLFLVNAATFVAYMLVLTAVRAPGPGETRSEDSDARGTYRHVVRNRPFMALIVLNMVFVAAGIVPLVEFLPVYAKNDVGMSEDGIGLLFLLNTIFIVVTQLPVAKALEGHRRMRALALMAVLWAVCWPLVIGGSHVGVGWAYALFGVVMVVFGIGECLHGGAMPALVADLAEPRLMGRYMAMSSLSWQVAFVIGPTVAGFVLAANPAALWLGALVLCAGAAVWSVALERAIPSDLRVTPRTTAAEALEGEPVADAAAPAAARSAQVPGVP